MIAGNGAFPLLLARAARAHGLGVTAVAFPEETRRDLARWVDEIHWLSLGQLGRLLRVFQRAGVRRVYMAGQIRHRQLFANLKLDWRAVALLAGLKDKRADSILSAVAGALGRAGMELATPLPLLREHLPGPGVLTRRRPGAEERRDLKFGYRVAKHLAGADIGQTVVVVKVAKPNQDTRFDMPVVGPRTVRSLRKAKASVLGFEAGQTLLLERERTLAEADAAGIALVAI